MPYLPGVPLSVAAGRGRDGVGGVVQDVLDATALGGEVEDIGPVDEARDHEDRRSVGIGGFGGRAVVEQARAARLAKADLASQMVYEFPELQGIMGTYYAHHDGEAEEVALALNEQYQPRFAGDELPATTTGQAVAIADKVDTLVGILGIGKHPTGDKDPFALRRAALGVLRIIVGRELPLDLATLAQQAAALYGDKLTNSNVPDRITYKVIWVS